MKAGSGSGEGARIETKGVDSVMAFSGKYHFPATSSLSFQIEL